MIRKMINLVKSNRGFTLIEMVIVLLVISVLLIVSLPNISQQSSEINAKGCLAFQQMVQGQVESYRMANNAVPASVETLQTQGYLRQNEITCPDGRELVINTDGHVTIKETP
ncbi:competence type IV pilus major pilin ComGC [Jeotgalibacillus soli]|uniref:ComG operon protein 3 n=1 Tax=Jeotgalibacillus soli TaxID=889306 RepID=A0A0C2V5W9_9BACL|nr:competence type IV pilus major pilin ComGC [Jeotgalibacillus soli]KIL44387.1 hypothetical protein KP78_33510 [Jeotgalibacillus soli]